MSANERQHGGDHYKKMPYEHWDFVCDTHQPYLIACATKYASRWRNKGGTVDLEKMIHYLDKAEERGVRMGAYHKSHLDKFIEQLPRETDRHLVADIIYGKWDLARERAKALVAASGSEVSPADG